MLSELVGVLSMLSGDYEHDEDMPRSPMITWDRINNTVKGNSYSKMLALSGGTIPDKGYFGVYLENGKTKLGELDEVFVFEARLGDRFMLGTSALKIKKIEKNRVIVTHSSSGGAKTPFWIGEGLGRPYESGLNFGRFLDEISKKAGTAEYLDWITQTAPMDEQGAKNLERYIMDQIEDLGCISNHKRIVVEYFSDDAGERRIVIHSHFGGRVNGALAMVMEEVLGSALHCQVQASNNDDGILINIMGYHEHPSNIFSLIKAEDIEDILINKIPITPLFAMSFRYNASRALMMGVKKFGKRSPLWIQRLRAMELMQITEKYPDHPLIVETFRECMGTILDVPHLVEIFEKITSGEVEVVERITPHPSPFTNELLFNFMGVAMYEGLLPDPRKPDNKLLSGKKVLNLNIKLEKNLLDKNAILEVTGKNNFLGHKKHINSMDELHDIMLTYGEIALNDVNLEGLLKLGIEKPMDWLFELKSQGRAINIENSAGGLWIAAEEWGMYSSGLGLGDSPVEDNTWTKDEALYRILRRFARYNSPFSCIDLASRYPLDNETILKYISRLEQDGVLISGNFMDSGEDEYCHSVIYEKIRIHSMNLSRKSIKANNVNVLADFVPNIQGIGKELVSPIEGLYDAAVKLKGLYLPVEWWEEFIFPSRVKNYKKSYIDRLLSSGRLIWRIKSGEGTPRLAWFEPSDMDFNSSCDFSQNILTEEEKNVFTTLKSRGACFLHTLSAFTMMDNSRLMAALEGLVWKGIVTNDSFEPIRYFLSGKSANAKARSKKRAIAFKAEMGRWETAPSIKQISIEDYIVLLLKRYGIVSKEIFQYERSQNIWNDAYEILKQWEYTGRVSRGYFVEGMSGIQFMMLEEIQKLSKMSQEIRVINACDPSQVYGQIAPRNQEDEPWMCIPSNTLIIREGRPVMIAEAYGERISILSDDENTLKYLEAMVEAFNTARIWPDRNKIRLKEFNGASPMQCPYAAELKSMGFENEMMEMVLWRKQG
jgi:ATP-dependent Lhr-like helicase